MIRLYPFREPDGNPNEQSHDSFVNIANCNGDILASGGEYFALGSEGELENIATFRELCREKPVITGTRVFYKKDLLNGEITHYAGSTFVEPVKQEAYIRNYDNERADKIIGSDRSLGFIRALFNLNSEINLDKIVTSLERLTDKDISEIAIETPAPDGRTADRNQAVCFKYDNERNLFLIYTTKTTDKGYAFWCDRPASQKEELDLDQKE